MSTATPYLLEDGSPRYGIRTEAAGPSAPAAQDTVDPRKTAREAADMTLAELALAALAYRTKSRDEDPSLLIQELRKDHPEAFREAGTIVARELGTEREWKWKLEKEDILRRTASKAASRKHLRWIFLDLLFHTAPFALLSVMLLLLDADPILALGVFLVTHYLADVLKDSVSSARRKPERLALSATEYAFIRQSIVTATLLDVLSAKGVSIPEATEGQLRVGFRTIQQSVQSARTMNF